ncbi:TPA: hypothetical protein MB350_002266 [Klebsiella quasipneumoniae subsp. similipneumoniae]|nr:hypothetical protein [Klebsiella quasipneumoniae subsp. similipneumoniae]HBT4827910.1 hypothetical protein [Klebsiella quasipneumoniae subsp. similipneumoniae]
MLQTLRGMFINYFSDTRELNTVAAKPYPRKTSQERLYAIGVVPARRQPQSGRISALAGHERVTAGKWRRRPVQPAAALR